MPEPAKAHSVPQLWGPNPGNPQNHSPDLLGIKQPLWRPLKLLPFGKPVFLWRKRGKGGEGKKEGLGHQQGSSISLSPTGSPSPQYQAHAGFDAVVVNAWDHLQGDGVLAGLHIIHLRTVSWSGRPQPFLPDPRHGKGKEMPGRVRDKG